MYPSHVPARCDGAYFFFFRPYHFSTGELAACMTAVG